ncbi:MAG: hypothetical protein RR547_05970 [Raoultibacter sp.]
MKKFAILLLSAFTIVALSACSGSTQSRPSSTEKINVVGMPIKDAYSALVAEGWDIAGVIDEDREKSGSFGMSLEEARNNVKNTVSGVEFIPAKTLPSKPGWKTVPQCQIFYKSGGQRQMIQDYEWKLSEWDSDYLFYLQYKNEGESSDSFKEAIRNWYLDISLYDANLVPDSYKATHAAWIARAAELLASL